MNIVTFCEIDNSLLSSDFTVEKFSSEMSQKADIAIIDINTIFDYEENKAEACKEKYASIAILEDESDYDAFKNFGIDAWIHSSDIDQISNIVNLVNKRLLQ